MGEFLSVSMDTSKDVVQPTLEEEAAKYDNLDASTDDRPEWLPEKFKSVEDMAKAYGELEKKFSSRSKEPAAEEAIEEEVDDEKPAESEDADEEQTDTPEKQARQATKEAGLDFDELSTSYWETGELSEQQYTKLEKAGIPKALVDQFIAGQEAVLTATRTTVFNAVGGEDRYNSMTEWATENLSKDEISIYNRAVNGGEINSAMMAVKGLKARFDADVGFEPQRQVRGEAAKPGTTTYRSIAELQKDIADPRYQKDAAFRKDVERKLGRSDIM